MQTVASVASVAGSRLVSSFQCSSRSFSHSVVQPHSLVRSRLFGLRYSTVRRSNKSGSLSSKASPYRGVVNEDIEGIPVGEYGERYLVPDHMEDDEDGIGDVKVECDANGCIVVMLESRTLADEINSGGYLRCDLSGCYFSPEAPAAKSFEVIEGEGWRLGYETAPESAGSFCAIVGAGGWSIALTGGEFDDFCTLIQTIRKGIITMDEDEITGRDDIVLQVEKGSIWMQCTMPKTRVGALQLLWQSFEFRKCLTSEVAREQEAVAQKSQSTLVEPGVPRHMINTQLKQAFEVRFILSGDATKRQAEGHWPADAVMDMLNKIDASSFNQPGMRFTENLPRRAAATV